MAMESFVLAGGCFWCLDAVYRTLRGVHDVVSGYTGGSAPHPTYEVVCTGATGHAEAVRVDFDPDVIPREVILDVFFTLHDPTQSNRQGADVGTQYRSAMFFAGEAQREQFEQARERAPAGGRARSSPRSSRSASSSEPRSTTRTSSRRTPARDTASRSRCRR